MGDSSLDADLVQSLASLLVPIKPPEEFRLHLRSGLQLAGQQHAQRRDRRRRRMTWQNWWVGVVAFGASIAAGSVIAYLLRSRLVHPARPLRLS